MFLLCSRVKKYNLSPSPISLIIAPSGAIYFQAASIPNRHFICNRAEWNLIKLSPLFHTLTNQLRHTRIFLFGLEVPSEFKASRVAIAQLQLSLVVNTTRILLLTLAQAPFLIRQSKNSWLHGTKNIPVKWQCNDRAWREDTVFLIREENYS